MQMTGVRALVGMALLVASQVHAQGAMGGIGEAMQRIGSQMQDYGAQRELIELQHRQEMERIHAQQQFELDRMQRERQAQAEQQRQERTGSEKQVEAAHPGWVQITRSKEFNQWSRRQPASVQALGASDRPSDAILMLDLFKRDQAANPPK